MRVLVIGAGRMGTRHVQGIAPLDIVSSVCLADIKKEALDLAKKTIGDIGKVKYKLLNEIDGESEHYDVCIIATTAGNRKNLCDLAVKCGVKNLMVEKPLGQSYEQVLELVEEMSNLPFSVVVNLNMRMYETFKNLKNDLFSLPQMKGEKVITLNTGTLGIGCNGIHYLDLLYFILDADRAELIAGDVDKEVIPSGRGESFCDFGGWSVINFYKNNEYLARAMISMSSKSTLFGSWDIVGPHGKIMLDEIAGKRVDSLRKEDSKMPISRYAADYMSPNTIAINSPFLGDLTAEWIRGIDQGRNLLPEIKSSLKVHKLMFDWLSKSKTHSGIFPIT